MRELSADEFGAAIGWFHRKTVLYSAHPQKDGEQAQTSDGIEYEIFHKRFVM